MTRSQAWKKLYKAILSGKYTNKQIKSLMAQFHKRFKTKAESVIPKKVKPVEIDFPLYEDLGWSDFLDL